jgi:hypothetical protein
MNVLPTGETLKQRRSPLTLSGSVSCQVHETRARVDQSLESGIDSIQMEFECIVFEKPFSITVLLTRNHATALLQLVFSIFNLLTADFACCLVVASAQSLSILNLSNHYINSLNTLECQH